MSANKCKNPERIMNVNEPKTQFWGVCCEGGKIYSQVVKQRFYITQAVLEPDAELRKSDDEFVKVEIQRDGFSFLLCVLQHDAVYQVSLNYIFDKGEKVAFRVDGKGKVFLSGYQVADLKVATNVSSPSEGVLQSSPLKAGKKPEGVFEVSSISPEKDETSQEIEEIVSPKITAETSKSPQKPILSNTPSKAFWNSLVNGVMDEDDDDEDDDDYVVEDDESESDDIEYDDDDDDEPDIFEETLGDSDDEVVVEETSDLKSTAGKRKQSHKTETPQKRQKKSQSSGNGEGYKTSSDSDSSESSEEKPVPKTSPVTETKSAEKKKKKKKKKASDISQKSAQTPENKPSAKKLHGGVEIIDIRPGNGPIARPGKILHVYYVGKLADSTVFDSRTRGRKPFSFKLGGQQVIKGWEIGLDGMRVGGRRKIIIPPKLGYGSSSIEGIPPNSTLYFIVELEAVN